MPDETARIRIPRLAWILFAILLALQLATAATHGLSVDEAHYALYGYFPAWSYFDHPPLVGWVQMPAVWLGGGDFLLRLAPLACWILSAVLIWKLTRRLFPENPGAATAALLLFVTGPMYLLLGISLRPDDLLLPLSAGIMLLVWRLRDPAEIGRLRPWLSLGLLLGLAGLAKYTALLLAASAAGVLLFRHGTGLLKRREPWLGAALAVLLVIPVFAWNAAHDWVSFRYQGLHATGGSAWEGYAFFLAQWEQIKLYGPLTFVAILAGLPGLRKEPGAAFCLAFALPLALVVAAFSGRGGSLSYWTAYGWLAAIPVGGWGIVRAWPSRPARIGLRVLGVIQVLFCLLNFARIADGGPEEGSREYPENPYADLYGWEGAALRARQLALSRGLHSITVMNWTLASRITWYARPFIVYHLDNRYDQFRLWFGKLPVGSATILVQWSRLPFEMPVQPGSPKGFAHAQFLEEMPIRHAGKTISHFDFYYCDGWGGEAVSARMPGNWISAF